MSLAYTPNNGFAFIEVESPTSPFRIKRIQEVNFSTKIYSLRKEVAVEVKAMDKNFVAPELNQKLIRLCQEICTENRKPARLFADRYDCILAIHFIPLGKSAALIAEIPFKSQHEKPGPLRELYEQALKLEKLTLQFR